MAAFLRKYGTGTGADVYVPIIKRAVVDFALSADWTPAAGDVKVSQDGGAAANIGTLPTAVTMGNTAMWKFVFSDAELQCAFLAVTAADAATKAVEDQMFVIETYGNASALHAFDLDTATPTVGGFATAAKAEIESEVNDALVAQRLDELLNADSDIDGAAPPAVGSVFHELMSKTGGSFTFDQASDSLEALRDRGDAAWITATGFSTHSAADVWSVATRTLTAFGFSVTVGVNNDKTGYALTAAERNSVADAYLDRADAIEAGITPRLAQRYIAAACAGTLSGSQTSSEVFQGVGVGTTRITATVDSSGNRTAINLG